MALRLLVADDHSLIVEGLSKLLETDFEIVRRLSDGRSAVTNARELQPDAVVMDISMPLLNGIEATRQIHQATPRVKVVILTQQTHREYVRAAFEAGASAYVIKQSAAAELTLAIREAVAGRYYVSPMLADASITPRLDPSVNPAKLFGGTLTPRQREVLQLVAEGKSAKDIANNLKISTKTAEFHKAALMQQLGLRTTAELTRYAIEHGLVEGSKAEI